MPETPAGVADASAPPPEPAPHAARRLPVRPGGTPGLVGRHLDDQPRRIDAAAADVLRDHRLSRAPPVPEDSLDELQALAERRVRLGRGEIAEQRPQGDGQMIVVVELSAIAAAVLRASEDAVVREPHRALTVGELTDALGVDRGVLDAALGDLDDAGLIRIGGDVSTDRSYVELTDAGRRALDGTA